MGGVISASRDPAQTQQAGHRCASLMSQSSESATPQWPVRRKRAPQARPRARAGDTSAPWIPTATSQSQDPAQAPRQLAPPSIPVPPKPPPPCSSLWEVSRRVPTGKEVGHPRPRPGYIHLQAQHHIPRLCRRRGNAKPLRKAETGAAQPRSPARSRPDSP